MSIFTVFSVLFNFEMVKVFAVCIILAIKLQSFLNSLVDEFEFVCLSYFSLIFILFLI